MLPTHEQVADYRGYTLYLRQPGFEFTPMMLAKIASFIVRGPDSSIAVYAFMYSMLTMLDRDDIQEERLLDQAVRTIESSIDDGDFASRHESTFEYRNGVYTRVTNPPWWIPTFGANGVETE